MRTSIFAIVVVFGPACNWPLENPYDQNRCEPACGAGFKCYKGRCFQCVNGKPEGHTCKTAGFEGGTLSCTKDEKLDTSKCYKCGDDKIGGKEECDGVNLGTATCKSQGYETGVLGCKTDCSFDTSKCFKCGDGVINGSEQCDGSQLGGKTCATQGFDGGTLSCSSACTFITSSCYKCGDGVINGSEQCDGSQLGGKSCQMLGCQGGTLACSSACTFNKAACTLCTCGNSTIESGEECDGSQLGGKTCMTQGFDGGTLGCSSACTFITSSCYKCGDGVINGAEECDGAQLGGKTCATQGFDGGSLGCAANCTFNTGSCYKCGDGVVNGSEQCDGTALEGKSCATQGFDGGTLGCSSACTFNTGSCYKCGDGVINGAEECEGSQLGGKTCNTQGFFAGTLACKGDCTFDTSGCHDCGDGSLNTGEQCDGTVLGGKTCTSMGFSGGTLKCTSDCKLSGCTTAGYAQILAGTFAMGSPTSEPCRYLNEDPHQVALTHDFEIQSTEATQGEFQSVMGYNPATFPSCGSDCPVEMVSWYEAAAYCNALSAIKGVAKCYSCSGSGASVTCQEAAAYSGASVYTCPGYRLPTEAEWEYAYRAGTTTAYYNGPNDSTTKCTTCSDANADAIGWYGCNSGGTTHPVKQKVANAWGLYDMAGNVWEWTHDWYQSSLGSSAVTDPVGSGSSYRVFRGGFWSGSAYLMRAANRFYNLPTIQHYSIGFRCSRVLP